VEKPSRHLKVTISEVVTPSPDTDDETEDNPNFRGVLGMATKLEIAYSRKLKGGVKCADPLHPVYVDSLVEALAYMISLTVKNPEDVPILTNMVFGHLAKRVQTYSGARFPEMYAKLSAQAASMFKDPGKIAERKQAFAEHFTMQLNGYEKPCAVCNSACEFKGEFDKE
jgi:hypothetical protein